MHIVKLLASVAIIASFTTSCTAVGTAMTTISKGVHIHSQERTPGDAVDDLIMETTINHHFFRADVNDLFKNVDIDVIEGRAFLTGNVDQHETMVQAIDLTWQVEGVREVINEIQVENTSNVIDAAQDIWIELQIEGELLITKGVHSNNYNIESVNGIVTLMGIAKTEKELNIVTGIASRTANVKKVISHIIMVDDPRRIIPKADKPEAHNE